MSRADTIVMLARQRSGTNPLRDVLDSHPDVFCTPEVFHELPSPDTELEVEMNFFAFLDRHPKATVRRAQSQELQEELFLDYLDFLHGFTDKRYVLVDVKYNSTHHFDGPWRGITEQPSMLFFMKRHGVKVLNLTRRNFLRYYLSWHKANLNETWAVPRDSDGPADRRVTLDRDDVVWTLESCRLENDAITRAFEGRPIYKTFDYEDLFPALGGPVSAQVLEWIAEWLAIEPAFAQAEPQLRKQSSLGLRDTIENFDEIAEALAGTPFEYCLEDERMYSGATTQGAA